MEVRTITISDMMYNIPLVLSYFVPGFIGITIYQTRVGNKTDNAEKAINSCVVSIVIVTALRAVPVVIGDYVVSILAIMLAAAIGWIAASLANNSSVNQWLANECNFTLNQAAIFDAIDVKGTYLVIHLKGESGTFEGSFLSCDDTFLTISGMSHFSDSGGKTQVGTSGLKERGIFTLSEIEWVEAIPANQ